MCHSSRFGEVTEVLDDGLPEPIPGSSHSLSDTLNGDIETIVEIWPELHQRPISTIFKVAADSGHWSEMDSDELYSWELNN